MELKKQYFKNKKVLWVSLAAVAALILLSSFTSGGNLFDMAASFIIPFEGFLSTPKWDNKQYSWGYGTAAPSSTGTITPEQARADLITHVQSDYAYLSPMITRNLSLYQWVALLDFSYQLGAGNAENLVDDINAGNDAVLEPHWKEYILVSGAVSQDSIDRRAAEWQEWVN